MPVVMIKNIVLLFRILICFSIINVSLLFTYTSHAAVPGVTPGEFSVDASGSANYSVPIAVPPGTAGMQPSLTLSYNSRSGNGLLGVGWSLGGLSVITRCPTTKFVDGFIDGVDLDTNDRYCIDGQRLIAVTGTYGAHLTEYRTAVDSFTKVVSYGTQGSGPVWFKAWTKSGQILEYGYTHDARIEAQNRNDVRLWAVNKISDTMGNYLLVSYYEDNANGQYWPSAINYTANDSTGLNTYASVEFIYAARSDVAPLYFAGTKVQVAKRLTNIKTYSGANLVRDYQLSYDNNGEANRSRLTQLQECDASAQCFKPTSFEFSSNTLHIPAAKLTVLYQGSANFSSHNSQIADINGDGLDDVVTLYASSCCLGAHVALALGNGQFGALSSYPLVNGINMSGYTPQIADINGDGFIDLVVLQANQNGLDAHVALGNGVGGFGTFQWNTKLASLNFSGHTPVMVDVNNDGRADVVSLYASSGGIGAHVALSLGNGTFAPIQWNSLNSSTSFVGHTPQIVDVNSDGAVDVVSTAVTSTGLYAHVALGLGNGDFAPLQTKPPVTSVNMSLYNNPRMVDINGDGLEDIVTVALATTGFWAVTAINNGSGGFNTPTYSTLSTGANYTPYTEHYGDFNGDGLIDIGLVATTTSGLYSVVALSNGNGGFEIPINHKTLAPGANYSIYDDHLGDFNGDGLTDVGVVATVNGAVYAVTAPSSSDIPDQLTRITTSLGTKTDITYKSITDSNVYTKGTGTVYPAVDIQAPTNVVSSVMVDDGVGGQRTTNYTYAALRASLDGQGSLGFAQMSALDVSTGIKTTTVYSQTYPYTGLVSRTEQRLSNGDLLGEVDTTFAQTQTHTGVEVDVSHPGVLFPYAATVTKKDYEID